MRIAIDGRILGHAIPDRVEWVPVLLGYNGLGAPQYGPVWTCLLGFSVLQILQFTEWVDCVDGTQHAIHLPHKDTGELTEYDCYVGMVEPRIRTIDRCLAAASGVDIRLTGITV